VTGPAAQLDTLADAAQLIAATPLLALETREARMKPTGLMELKTEDRCENRCDHDAADEQQPARSFEVEQPSLFSRIRHSH